MFTPGGDLIYCIDPSKQGHWHLHLCIALQEILGLPEPPHFLVPGYTATLDRWLDPRTRQIRTSAEIFPLVQQNQALLNAVFGTSNLVWQMSSCQEGVCDPIVLETYRPQFPQLWEDHDLIVRFERNLKFSYPYTENFPSLQHQEVAVTNINREGSGHEVFSFHSPQTHAASVSVSSFPREQAEHAIAQASVQPNPYEATLPHSALASKELISERHSPTPDTSGGTPSAANMDAPICANTSPSPTTASSDAEEILLDPELRHAQGYVFRLFVSGHSAATEYTLVSLHQLLETSLRHPYTLKIIDIFKHPEQAEANQISATPTLLRVWPQPVRRIVGDLTDAERVLRLLAAPED